MPTPKDEQVRLYLWKLYQQRIGSNTAQSDKIAKSARQAILYLYVYTSILILIYLIWPSSYAILIPDIVLQNSRAAQIQKCIKEAAQRRSAGISRPDRLYAWTRSAIYQIFL